VQAMENVYPGGPQDARLISFSDPPFAVGTGARLHQGICSGSARDGGQYTHAAIWTVMAFRDGRCRTRLGLSP